ncbi:MAG: tripartite tricarboxylate transporter TctB family protein [Alphaproteobacteria bacterium]
MRFESALVDRLTSVIFMVIGAAMLYGGFVMDRLEIREIHPASIPGLVPMMLGVALVVCSVLLFLGASGKESGTNKLDRGRGSAGGLLIAAAWSAFYALALVGRVPFGVATGLYICVFALYFGWPSGGDTSRKLRWVVVSIVFSTAMAAAISTLFRYGFLVRLP